MKKNRNAYIGARIDPSLRERLDRINKRFRVPDTAMVDDALTALANYVETRGKYEAPMAMVFDEEAVLAVAEEQAPMDPPTLQKKQTPPRKS